MAKKGLKEDIKDIISDVIRGHLISRIKEQFEDLVDKIQDAIVVTQKKLIRGITSVAMLLLGIAFLAIGTMFWLTDIIGIARSTVFLAAGIIFVLVSIILAQSAKLLKYHFKK